MYVEFFAVMILILTVDITITLLLPLRAAVIVAVVFVLGDAELRAFTFMLDTIAPIPDGDQKWKGEQNLVSFLQSIELKLGTVFIIRRTIPTFWPLYCTVLWSIT